MNSTLENTTTKADEIQNLKQQVYDAGREERQLALEQDSMPELLANAARADAKAKAAAARSGEAPATVEDSSEVPALLQRQRNLPVVRWSAGIRTNSLQIALHDLEIEAAEQRAREAQTGLAGLKTSADEATRVYEEQASLYRGAVNAVDAHKDRRAVYARELRLLEENMPGFA